MFSTDAVATLTDVYDVWYDSPEINFILNANTRYQLGVISDRTFTYRFDGRDSGNSVSSGGLTLAVDSNGNSATFCDPTLQFGGGVLQSFRAFGPTSSVPEPGSLAMLAGVGVTGGLFAFRQMRKIKK